MDERLKPIARAIARTRRTLFWERSAAAIIPVLAAVAGGLGVLLSGFLPRLPGALHAAVLAAMAAGLGWLCWRSARRFRWPKRWEAIGQLERNHDLRPGLLADLQDQPAAGDASLWAAMSGQWASRLGPLTLRRPKADMAGADPYRLRFVGVGLLVVGLILSRGAPSQTLEASISPQFGGPGPALADAWITPPGYTGKAPIFLVRRGPLADLPSIAEAVPAGSILTVRVTGQGSRVPGAALRTRGVSDGEDGGASAAAPPPDITEEGATRIVRLPLHTDTELLGRLAGETIALTLPVTQDGPPSVTWQEAPSDAAGRRVVIAVDIYDDYGIEEATLKLSLADTLDRAPDVLRPATDVLNAEATFDVPALTGAAGAKTVELDLTEHPWAGLPVELIVEVVDGASQRALSVPQDMTLPERNFYNALAQTVIEERQNIALNPDSTPRSAQLFGALTFAPEQFAADAGEYLLLRTASLDLEKVDRIGTDAIVENFWPLALALEDVGLALAKRRLEAAQKAVREALASGAAQAEVDRLLEELRQAMREYIAALAASGDAEMAGGATGPSMDAMDLEDILAEIAELRRQGDSEAARRRLAELEQMLANLQIAQGGGGSGTGGQGGEPGEDGESALDEAGEMIDRQRRLADETFGAGQAGEPGEGQEGARTPSDLAREQGALADDIEGLASGQAGEQSGDQDGAGAEAFRNAQEAMEDAADALARGDLGIAQDLQERALGFLRQGAEDLVQQELAENAERGGSGQDGDANAGDGQVRRGWGDNRDPLGRVYGEQGDTGVEIPDLVDAEAVRALVQSLRDRLADPTLPAGERSYIERLLKRF